MTRLMSYIQSTWMESTVWPVSGWSVFMQATRTNNDCEGWHRRLNGRAGRGQIQLYLLVPLLHVEARQVTLQLKLLSDNKLKRRQRKRYRDLQGKLFALWDKLQTEELSDNSFLTACSKLYGPVNVGC